MKQIKSPKIAVSDDMRIFRTKRLVRFVASCLAVGALSTSAMAATLLVDIGRTGQALLESGYQEWNTSGTFDTTAETKGFSYSDTVGGTLTATLTPTTVAGGRNYGVGHVSDQSNLPNQSLWSDLYFFNNNTAGTLTLSLQNLKAGDYSITTYHYGDSLLINNDSGTADISINGVDTGQNAQLLTGFSNPTAAQVQATAVTVMFTVANDSDVVNILFDGLVANNTGDTFGLNGFKLSAVPEPSAALLGALGFIALLRRRRA